MRHAPLALAVCLLFVLPGWRDAAIAGDDDPEIAAARQALAESRAKLKEAEKAYKKFKDKIGELKVKRTAIRRDKKLTKSEKGNALRKNQAATVKAESKAKKPKERVAKAKIKEMKARQALNNAIDKKRDAEAGGEGDDDDGEEPDEDDPEAEKKQEELARKNRWIDAEIVFIKALDARGFDDLANERLVSVRSGEVHELDADQENYLKTVLIQFKLNIARQKKDIVAADSALQEMKGIVATIPADKKYLRRKANVDLVGMYFQLARTFTDEIFKAEFKIPKGGAAGNEAAVTAARLIARLKPKALNYYQEGIKLALPLHEDADDRFSDVWDRLGEVKRGSKTYRLLRKRADRLWQPKMRLTYLIADAYAAWPQLVARGSPARARIMEPARDWMEDQLSVMPQEKTLNTHYIRMLSLEDDQIGKKDEMGDPIIRFDEGVDTRDMGPDPEFFHWNSDRMRFIFEFQFLNKTRRKWHRQKNDWYKPSPLQVGQALYYYTESWIRFVRGAFAQSQFQASADLKGKWRDHLEALKKKCLASLKQVTAKQPVISSIKDRAWDQIRFTALLKLVPEAHLLLAEIAKASNNQAEMNKQVGLAFSGPSLVNTISPPNWRLTAQERLLLVKARAESIVGGPLKDLAEVILFRANQNYGKWLKEKDPAKKEALAREALALFYRALGELKETRNKNELASTVMKTWGRIGTLSLKLGDYDTGYIANLEIVQRFQPRFFPRVKFASIDGPYESAKVNLRFAASRILRQEDSPFHRELYVDALKLIIFASDDPNPDLLVDLLNQYKRLGLYNHVEKLIGQIPKTHVYYRTVHLMGAAMFQSLMKKARRKLDKLPDPDHPRPGEKLPEGEDLAKLKSQRAQLLAEMQEHRVQAEKYAADFIRLYQQRPPLPANARKKTIKVYRDEDNSYPLSMLIPIQNAFTAQEYDKAIAECNKFIANLGALKKISPEARNGHLATARWYLFLAILKRKNAATAPLDEVAANLEALGRSARDLDELADAARALGISSSDSSALKYSKKTVMFLGGNWKNLANRIRRRQVDLQKEGKAAAVEAMEKRYKQYLIKSVSWFGKAEEALYEKISLVFMIAREYYNQQMYEKAEGVYDKGIRYWDESLFTNGRVFAKGKSLRDLKGASIPAGIKSQCEGVVDLTAIKGAADEAALLQVLNEQIANMDWGQHKEQAAALLAAAGTAYAKDKKLKENLAQAQDLLTRSRNRNLNQKLNRFMLEAVFPAALARSEKRPLIPTAAQFDAALKGYGRAFQERRPGPTKRLVSLWMHNPKAVKLQSGKEKVKQYLAELKERAKKATSPQEKAELNAWLNLLDPGLRIFIYGVKKNNKIEKRSYNRARAQIASMITFFEKEMPLKTPKKLPTSDFLKDMSEALKFDSRILAAKRKYARTKVVLGKIKEAKRYLEDLAEQFPKDKRLRLDVAGVNTAMAKQTAGESYNQEATKYFMKARVICAEILQTTKRYSLRWWEARLAYFENEKQEIFVRQQAGQAGEQQFEIMTKIYWAKKRKHIERSVKTDKLEKQVKNLLSNLRLVRSSEEFEVAPENIRNPLDKIWDDMAAAGFKLDLGKKKKPAVKPPATKKKQPASPSPTQKKAA